MQGFIQAVQTLPYDGTNNYSVNTINTAAKSAGGQEMNFMHMLQLMFDSNNLDITCDVQEQIQPASILQPAVLGELLTINEDTQVKRVNTDQLLKFKEPAFFELVTSLLNDRQTGIEPEKFDISLNYLNTACFNAEDLVGQRGLSLNDKISKLQMDNALLPLLKDVITEVITDQSTASHSNTAEIMPTAVESSDAQNKIAALAEQLSIMLLDFKPLTQNASLVEAIMNTNRQGGANSLNANSITETANNVHQTDLTQVALNNVDSTTPVAKPTGVETVPAVRSGEQVLLIQLAETTRGQVAKNRHEQTNVQLQSQTEKPDQAMSGPVYQNTNVSTQFNATGDSVRQIIEQYLMLMLADKSTTSGSNTVGIPQPVVEGPAAQNAITSLAEQLYIMIQEPAKILRAKRSNNGVPTQQPHPLSNPRETGSSSNTVFLDLKSVADKFTLKEAITTSTGQSEVNDLLNVNKLTETTNNARLANQTQVTPSNVDITAAPAKLSAAEATPAVRSSEQLLFMQLAEAIRGQVAKDGHGRTHIRLQLTPENLGEVAIRMVYKDGNVSTHFHTATESVRQMIESSLVQLRETLATHNLNLQQSTVTAGDDQGRWAHESNQERQFNRRFQQSSSEHGEREEISSESVVNIQKSLYPNRVNHFV